MTFVNVDDGVANTGRVFGADFQAVFEDVGMQFVGEVNDVVSSLDEGSGCSDIEGAAIAWQNKGFIGKLSAIVGGTIL